MATINVGGFGFGKHFKTLEDAINSPQTMDSDTIVIHKQHLVMTNPAVITKTLYIQGNDVSITVKQGQAGLMIKNGTLHMSDVHFNLPPQANAMVFDSMYNGEADLENVTTEHNKCKLREIYPSVKVTAPSQGQPQARIALNKCDFDYFDGEMDAINITNSTIGRIYKPQSNIIAYNFEASDVEFDNCYLSNANTATIDKFATAGQIAINGHFNFRDVEILNKGIDMGNGKVTNDYYKAQRLINDAVHNQMANKTNVLFNIFGDQKFSSGVRLENVKFPDAKPFYLRQFLAGKYNEIVIKNADIPQLDMPSQLQNGSLSLEDTVDKSQWEVSNVDTANRQSSSPLFATKRKVAGVASVNGLADITQADVQASSALDQLDSLIGLTSVKKFVHKMVDSAAADAYLAKRGLGQTKTHYLHTVLSGNQGTGKTMVAHIMARALYQKGVLPTNKFRAVKASMLLGQYNGETRQKTRKVMQSAMDGVLFIDEAYGLAHQENSNDNYGDQAVEEIIQDMENAKGRIMVIMAGYTQNMQEFFRTSNPGLTSRFVNWCQFPDYTPKEMLEILQYQLDHTSQHWHLADNDAVLDLRTKFLKAIEPGSGMVGNGRFCRTVSEKLTDQAKARIAGYGLEKMQQMSDDQLTSITTEDIDIAMPALMQQQAQMHGIGI